MRLMIIGQLQGHIGQAGKIALQRGAKVTHCEDAEQALGALRNGKGADAIMMDIKLGIGDFITSLREERFHLPVVACGVNPDTRAAVKAIQDGAKEFVPLPPDVDLIAAVLEAVSEEDNTMIANDPSMQPVVKLIQKIAPSEATVLITGESGTGKEVLARTIHKKSNRKAGPFIAINCAAIPENLLESELFGHEKGAFTGATARRLGKFEEATGGTLLLDEVSEMHPQLQAKLLRAIQEREITRVGSNDAVKIDVRILATSNRNLAESVKRGEFREDLYFRLNVVNMDLPPLRARPLDIPTLAQFFADKYAEANGVEKKKISTSAEEKLLRCKWRGNIRELENTMHRAILMSIEDELEADAINIQEGLQAESQSDNMTHQAAVNAPDIAGVSSAGSHDASATSPAPQENPSSNNIGSHLENPGAVENMIGRTVADVERDLIINTLDHCLGNRTHAANILGISIRTLRNKLNQYKQDGVAIPDTK